jgi:hypothetical protein
MTRSKEAELTTAVLTFALRCLQEGDLGSLRDMNFGPAELQALEEIRMGDLCHLESIRAHCLKAALNREVYWPMLSQLKFLRESESLQHTLIEADAPLDMMQTFFGMSGREYTKLRRTLMVESTSGRPIEPTDEEIQQIWSAWREKNDLLKDGLLPPEEYLNIHRDTQLPLRAIWRQTRLGLDFAG